MGMWGGRPFRAIDPLGLRGVVPIYKPVPPVVYPSHPALGEDGEYAGDRWSNPQWFDDLISAITHPMAAPGNHADTEVAKVVSQMQSDRVLRGEKRPDRCKILDELEQSGMFPRKALQATRKAWGCRPSRASKDKC